MTKKKSNLSRRVRREQMQAQKRKKQLYYLAAAVGAIVIIGLLAFIRQLTSPSIEDVALPDTLEIPANAEGKAWGPVDAPVLIEEYGDFQ